MTRLKSKNSWLRQLSVKLELSKSVPGMRKCSKLLLIRKVLLKRRKLIRRNKLIAPKFSPDNK